MRFKRLAFHLTCVLTLGLTASTAGASSPWGPDDEAGNTNTQGYATYFRAALQMLRPGAKAYRLAHLFSPSMPQSPFAAPWQQTSSPTAFLPPTLHAANSEIVSGDIGNQGTQMDALGHFGYLPSADSDEVLYYNGFTQDEVKGPDGLLKLGIDKSKPIVTTAILLDARKHLNAGQPLEAGQLITTEDIEYMLHKQHLRGLLPGDVLFIYTGWSELWQDDNTNPFQTEYYSAGPGLSYDAALYLQQKFIVLVGLDNPFTDPVNEGFLQGQAPPPEGTPPGLPFAIHHNNLTQAGIHQIQNLDLKKLAQDKVYLSAVFISPLPIRGGAGSPVAPVAIGAPW
ncbi:MAG TPA: cyclase family protein [bacterium]|nr:cyclase family protein [bacterium]